jgi:phosphomannomutase/phosphomannomutase/phosphoglucomutase
MKFDPVIFREYDIRGVVDKDFDADFAYELGRAYITYLVKQKNVEQPRVSVGHDARLSSPEIAKRMAEGIQSCGGHVYFLGLVTSPISYFSTFTIEGLHGAMMVTGSHNPPEYNGFKVSVGKTTIFGDEIQELRKIMEAQHFVGDKKGGFETFDIFPSYLKRYKEEFGTITSIPFVLDCGNGAAGCIVKKLFEGVGLKPTILFEQPDGKFPNHHPDPTVEKNLVDLKATVAEKKAIVGIGFDGDADRIGIIDENGKVLLGDEFIALMSRFILKERKGGKIIGDVKCSDRMFADIAKHGGQPIMWKTGHSLVKEKIKAEKSPFGGELSGHIFFADRNYGYDDALYAALRLVEVLSKTGKTISQLLEGFPPAFNTPEIRIDTTEEKKHSIVERLKSVFTARKDVKVNLIDGIRVSFDDGWALARASNTQPVLVLRFESSTQAGLDRIQKQFETIVQPLL